MTGFMFFFFAFGYFQPNMSTSTDHIWEYKGGSFKQDTVVYLFLLVITHQHFYIPANAASLLKAEKNPLKN
jgi:hypothetical protein